MRWISLVGLLFLLGFTPLHTTYETPEKVEDEFNNLEIVVQDKQFTVYTTTPTLKQLQEGEVVILSSGTARILFRINNDLFEVIGSCITVNR